MSLRSSENPGFQGEHGRLPSGNNCDNCPPLPTLSPLGGEGEESAATDLFKESMTQSESD